MRVPYRYAAPWVGYWTFLAERSMQRWRCMAEEVEDRRYGSDKVISDILQFWGDATIGWCAALRGSGTGSTVPLVFFSLHPQQQADGKEIDFFAPSCPQGDPEVAYLVPIHGGSASEINESKVRLCVVPRRHALVIHLEGLWKQGQPDLTPGVYKGLIHIGEEPVAHLVIRVADRKSLRASDEDLLAGLEELARAAVAASAPKVKRKAKAKGRRPKG